jgi:hypothetical protein
MLQHNRGWSVEQQTHELLTDCVEEDSLEMLEDSNTQNYCLASEIDDRSNAPGNCHGSSGVNKCDAKDTYQPGNGTGNAPCGKYFPNLGDTCTKRYLSSGSYYYGTCMCFCGGKYCDATYLWGFWLDFCCPTYMASCESETVMKTPNKLTNLYGKSGKCAATIPHGTAPALTTTLAPTSSSTSALASTAYTTTASAKATTTLAPTTSTTTTTTLVPTTIATSTTSVTSTLEPVVSGIHSGDLIFLVARSGNENIIDVEGGAVQARWVSHGNWQAITIEKEKAGSVFSGDTVFLKTQTGAHIDITGDMVQARWNDKGDWQSMIIEKASGHGAILPGDVVCLKAHTGKHLDVEGAVVRARWNDCGDWQKMLIEKEAVDAVFSASLINLVAYTGKRVEVDGHAVQARWDDNGTWQRFSIENYGGRAIYSGDVVFLTAHTGMMVDVEGEDAQARWNAKGTWQKLVIERKSGRGAVLPGDTIFLKAHTGKMIEVEGEAVQARWSLHGSRQSFVIDHAALRRLKVTRTVGSPALQNLRI